MIQKEDRRKQLSAKYPTIVGENNLEILVGLDTVLRNDDVAALRNMLDLVVKNENWLTFAEVGIVMKQMLWCWENLEPGTFAYEAPRIVFQNDADAVVCKLAVG